MLWPLTTTPFLCSAASSAVSAHRPRLVVLLHLLGNTYFLFISPMKPHTHFNPRSLTLQFLNKQKRSVCCLCLSVSSILLASHLQQKFWHVIMCISHTHTHMFHYLKGASKCVWRVSLREFEYACVCILNQ